MIVNTLIIACRLTFTPIEGDHGLLELHRLTWEALVYGNEDARVAKVQY